MCAACICVGLLVLEVFQPPRPPKSASIKPPVLDFACYATSYAQNPTSISSLQFMLFLMPKKSTYAVVRASIMGQGLPADKHSHYTKQNHNVSCILCKPQRLHISNRRPRYPQTAPLLGERYDSGDSSKTCQVKRQQFQLQQISSN